VFLRPLDAQRSQQVLVQLEPFSCSSNQTVWYDSIIGFVNQSRSPPVTRSSAVANLSP